ncbi:DUF397 domain-containing protein [Streptomyces sp. NPDC046197]|uniref:DUF397 domain-containing protein n=1 Tax=Streptomyces sp. NPDC046197 TaxID=3154337 RepID=UPI0033C2A2A0
MFNHLPARGGSPVAAEGGLAGGGGQEAVEEPGEEIVEVAHGAVPAALPVRDSKRPAGPAVVFDDTTWGVFVDALKRGDV